MKIYVVNEIGYEYNDEFYGPADNYGADLGSPIRAYKNKENAEAKAKELNHLHLLNNPFENSEGKTITDYYSVKELEVEDEDLVSYSSAVEKVRQVRKQAQELAKEAFKEEARKIFNKYEIESFGWCQYTPYFNDGDTCTFSVNNYPDGILINGMGLDDMSDGYEYRYDSKTGKRSKTKVGEPDPLIPVAKKATLDISKFLQLFEDDDLREMFDDHVTVTVTKKGNKIETSTEHCEHD